MKKQLITPLVIAVMIAIAAQPSFAMKGNRPGNHVDQFTSIISTMIFMAKRLLSSQHDHSPRESPRQGLPLPLLTTFCFVSQTGTPFYFLIRELPVLMRLSRSIATMLSDLEGSDISTVSLNGVSDDTLYLLTQMVVGAKESSLLSYISNLSRRQIAKLQREAELLDSQALKNLLERALPNRFAILPDDVLPVIFAHVGPIGRTQVRCVDQRFRRCVNLTRLPISNGGFGWTDTLPVVTTITVGQQSIPPVLHGDMLHVTSSWDSAVYIINTSTNNLVAITANENTTLNNSLESHSNSNANLPALREQMRYAVSDKDDDEYEDAGILYVIDEEMNVVALLQVGGSPQTPVIYGQMLYVANHGDGTISVIDANVNEVVATIQVGIGPLMPVVRGQMLYVVNKGSGSVSVIDIGGYLQGQI